MRQYGSNITLIHHRDKTEHNKHYYTLMHNEDLFTTAPSAVGFHHSMSIPGQPYDYSIYDICIYDDTIYVCGELLLPYGEPIYDPVIGTLVPVNIPKGFLAKIGMTYVAGSQWEMKYKIFDDVERLNKLTVYHPNPELSGFRKMIVATAELPSTYSQKSCLMEIKEELNGDWSYSIIQSDLCSREVLSDVMANGNSLYVSSYQQGDADPDDEGHWFFYIHKADFKGFTEMCVIPNVPEPDPMGWDTRYMTSSHTGWGWHSGEGPMLMKPINEWDFSLTFLSKNYTTGEYGIISVSIPWMLGLASSFVKLNATSDTEFKDISYLSSTDEMTPLIYNNTTPNGEVNYPKRTIGGLPEYMYSNGTYHLNSVDAFSGARLVIGGTQTNNNTVVVIDQQHNCENGCATCLDNDFNESIMLKKPYETKKSCNWDYVISDFHSKPFMWETATGMVGLVTKTIICKTNH